jgi:hypothetical protein
MMIRNRTTQRMGRGVAGEQTMGRHPTTMVVTPSSRWLRA